MAIDLNAMSRAELEELRRDVEKALKTVEQRERQAAREAAEAAARQYGFSLAELTGSAGKSAKAALPAKYRNPADADQTWSGRGRKPQWIKDAEAAGTDLSTFEI